MNSRRILRVMFIFAIIVANIGCDQVSKKLVRQRFGENEFIQLLHNHLIVIHVENAGAFLSFGDSLSGMSKYILLTILPVVGIAFAGWYLLQKHYVSNAILIGISFIIGGGIGNLFDRIVHESVTDFLYLHFGALHTGVFNLADLSITSGATIIFLHSLFGKRTDTGKLE